MGNIKDRLAMIYENKDIDKVWTSLEKRMNSSKEKQIKDRKQKWDEEDVVLITYADQFQEKDQPTLATFKKMFDRHLANNFEVVHLLPFYPYSSDDGFSVIDYKKVNPIAGDWEDIENLSLSTRLMFDYVCNHISAQSEWFQEYLKGNQEYQDFFIEMAPTIDLSAVTRPRATPVLTKFSLADGSDKHIWTTFSEDQIDLNFRNPQVLLKMVDVLLYYVEQGAEYIRLDAVGFMWKEPGTTCIHLEKTHQLIKLFRDISDEVSQGTAIITETNVPHKDNISYFGNGHDEAHMVYQFPLPPLVLYSINRGNGSALTEWAKNLGPTGGDTTFFNFLASHDGIGVNPIRGIIPEKDILEMIEDLKAEGALVSYKKNPDGTESPYEINVTYLDALNKKSDEDEIRLKRFLVAHSILLALPGVPAVYIQSMLGSRNDYDGVAKTGMNRSINRQKYDLSEIETELMNPDSLRNKIYTQLSKIIRIRKAEPLFNPDVSMEVLDLDEKVFAFKRKTENESLLVIHNLTNEIVDCEISGRFTNLLTGEEIITDEDIKLDSYQFLWLKPIRQEEKR
ncbi:alpha-amylase family glycosyl hydrolase [Bacillus sp. V33-4]|uniref:alpha-amylase family glycosyl hydrolase n=1 Tax=Bacillus sp. V33-4 TaxID=2054169 RepID=UPI000C78AD7E|nr:alpha-amylase family glycosyl hydrolase [Bacillus sp. V33-4]PLR80402.1 sugar phosphorylase [Bacillus sp. V33-4]